MGNELVQVMAYENIEEETNGKEEDNVVQLITGGKGPTDYNTDDWLSPLEEGTMFLFRDKTNRSPFLGQAKVLAKSDKAIYLGLVIGGQTRQDPVDPMLFCKTYGLYENQGCLKDAADIINIKEETTDETVATEDEHEHGDRVQGKPDGSV